MLCIKFLCVSCVQKSNYSPYHEGKIWCQLFYSKDLTLIGLIEGTFSLCVHKGKILCQLLWWWAIKGTYSRALLEYKLEDNGTYHVLAPLIPCFDHHIVFWQACECHYGSHRVKLTVAYLAFRNITAKWSQSCAKMIEICYSKRYKKVYIVVAIWCNVASWVKVHGYTRWWWCTDRVRVTSA